MTLRQLRELTAGAPDDAEVVVPAHDHSYLPAHHVLVRTAMYNRRERHWSEDADGPETESEKRKWVIVIE